MDTDLLEVATLQGAALGVASGAEQDRPGVFLACASPRSYRTCAAQRCVNARAPRQVLSSIV
jgi:hypothetical protein